MKMIWGYVPKRLFLELNIVEDKASFLDESKGDYEYVISTKLSKYQYFRTYNPEWPNFLSDKAALTKILIWDPRSSQLKAFKDFENLVIKLEVMGPGEALADTIFWENT